MPAIGSPATLGGFACWHCIVASQHLHNTPSAPPRANQQLRYSGPFSGRYLPTYRDMRAPISISINIIMRDELLFSCVSCLMPHISCLLDSTTIPGLRRRACLRQSVPHTTLHEYGRPYQTISTTTYTPSLSSFHASLWDHHSIAVTISRRLSDQSCLVVPAR